MSSFKDFTIDQEKYCFGHQKESEASLARIESELQVALPAEFKWFLRVCGYGDCQAVSNLDTSVADTKRFRETIGLPKKYIVLDDRNDSGVVLLDTESPAGTVIWVDTHALLRIAAGTLKEAEQDYFPDFASWVRFCVGEAIDEESGA